MNHSAHASYLRRYANAQVTGVVVGGRRPFRAVLRRCVMPHGITDDLASAYRGPVAATNSADLASSFRRRPNVVSAADDIARLAAAISQQYGVECLLSLTPNSQADNRHTVSTDGTSRALHLGS